MSARCLGRCNGIVDLTDQLVGGVGSIKLERGLPVRIDEIEGSRRHVPDENLLALVHVRSDLEEGTGFGSRLGGAFGGRIPDNPLVRIFQMAEGTGEKIHPVELRMFRNPVDLVDQGGNFHLDHHPVFTGVDSVGGLYRQFPDPVEDLLDSSKKPSVVCRKEMPFCTFLSACRSPRSGTHLSDTARPDAFVPGAGYPFPEESLRMLSSLP
jgi:hypothetical protein